MEETHANSTKKGPSLAGTQTLLPQYCEDQVEGRSILCGFEVDGKAVRVQAGCEVFCSGAPVSS